MKTKLARTINILALFFVFLVLPRVAYAASTLTATSATTALANGDSTVVTVLINTDRQVKGTDAILNISSSDFDVSGQSNGGFFDNFSAPYDSPANQLQIKGLFLDSLASKTTSGNAVSLATFTVTAKKSSGTSTISFVCSGSNPSDIFDINWNDILLCSANPLTISFTNTTTPTNTPTPTPTSTPTPAPTATPTPMPTATPAPNNGHIAPTCTGLSINPNKGAPTLWATLTCSGFATNADVNAAEFVFGDGKVQLVQKSIGNSGSISVLHPYTSKGSFTAACRLRDNNQLFSRSVDSCRKVATVTAPPSGTSLARGTGTTTGSGTGTKATPTPVRAVTPQVVQLTPYVLAPLVTPVPTAAPTGLSLASSDLVKNIISIAGIAIVLGLVYLILKKLKSNSNPPGSLPPTNQPPTIY